MNSRPASSVSEPLIQATSFDGNHTVVTALPMLSYLRHQLDELADTLRARPLSLHARHELLLHVGRCESGLREISGMVDLVTALERDCSPAAKSMRSILERHSHALQQALKEFRIDSLTHPLDATASPTLARP